MIRHWLIVLVAIAAIVTLPAAPSLAQEQIDKADANRKAPSASANIAIRVKVTKTAPAQQKTQIQWRHGGEGLGGLVTHGVFTTEEGQEMIPLNQWSKLLPLN